MTIVKRNKPGRMRLSQIMGIYRHTCPTTQNRPFFKVDAIYIHASSTNLTVSDTENLIHIPQKRTLEIQVLRVKEPDEVDQLNDIWISQAAEIGVFAVEYFLEDHTPNPLLNTQYLSIISDVKISNQIIAQRASFLRRSLTQSEIQSRLRFMDAEFGMDVHKRHRLLSVAILDYDKQTLLHTLVKPRVRIKDFLEQYHGIKETDVTAQMDEYDAINAIHRLLAGNILVGHDVQMELKGCAIPVQTLLGIRDTAAAPVFNSFNIDKKGDFYSLKVLARTLCNFDIQGSKHSAIEDARAVWHVYKKVEDMWTDTIDIPKAVTFLGQDTSTIVPQVEAPMIAPQVEYDVQSVTSQNYLPSITAGAWIQDNMSTLQARSMTKKEVPAQNYNHEPPIVPTVSPNQKISKWLGDGVPAKRACTRNELLRTHLPIVDMDASSISSYTTALPELDEDEVDNALLEEEILDISTPADKEMSELLTFLADESHVEGFQSFLDEQFRVEELAPLQTSSFVHTRSKHTFTMHTPNTNNKFAGDAMPPPPQNPIRPRHSKRRPQFN